MDNEHLFQEISVFYCTNIAIFKKYQKFSVRVNHAIRHNQKTKKWQQLAAMTSSEERDFKGIKFFTNENPSFQFL